MDDKEASPGESRLVSQLRQAGISDATLQRAAETAARLCAGSRPVEGGTLNPRSPLEYDRLFAALARKQAR